MRKLIERGGVSVRGARVRGAREWLGSRHFIATWLSSSIKRDFAPKEPRAKNPDGASS
jgi:hypothetical protein